MKTILKRTTFFVLVAFSFSYCTTVPLTGRTQLKFMPDSELLSMSFSQYDQFLSQHRLATNQMQTSMVREVGVRIQQAVEKYMADNNMSR
jgi:hypothetical protein